MDCIVCNATMIYSFTKDFGGTYALNEVEYWICPDCGFVGSKTHFEMDDATWVRLNSDFHRDVIDGMPKLRRCRSIRHFGQANLLYILARHNLIKGRWLDWGSGSEGMSRQLAIHYGLGIENYDAYLASHPKPQERKYGMVMCSGVFEHVRSRETLDEIEMCVAPKGCFGIHTMIFDTGPTEPFPYALPVHCAFFTWRSIKLLMHAWGYYRIVCHKDSPTWLLFQDEAVGVDRLNQLIGRAFLEPCEEINA